MTTQPTVCNFSARQDLIARWTNRQVALYKFYLLNRKTRPCIALVALQASLRLQDWILRLESLNRAQFAQFKNINAHLFGSASAQQAQSAQLSLF